MESAKSGHHTVAGRRRHAGAPAEPREGRIARTDPRSRSVNRSSRADRYASFADEVLKDLNPRGPLERLMADRVVQSAWKLKSNLENQGVRDRTEDAEAKTPKARVRPTELDHASKSVRDALESLDFLRSRFPQTQSFPIHHPEPISEPDTEILSNEWPVVPCEGFDDLTELEEAPEDDEVPSWHDRLVFDFEVSDVSPVVKGTWITVAHVVSLIVDGWAWSDILRTHPELNEDDIRTCVAYAMAEENSAP